MSLIDFHTHFFPDGVYQALCRWFEAIDWTIVHQESVDARVAYLKNQGLAHVVSLHYPHKVGMTETLNLFAHELEKKHPDFIVPFGSLHPDDSQKESILRTCFADFKFRGLKIHCHVQKVAPDDPRMDEIYELSQGKIILIHCGTGPHFKDKPVNAYGYDVSTVSGVARFEKVVRKHPKVTFVVPHLGYEEMNEFLNLLPDYPNLYLDTSMALAGYFPTNFDFGRLAEFPDRLLFGTDFPIIPHPWEKEKNILLGLGLGKEIEDKIFYQNAQSILKL